MKRILKFSIAILLAISALPAFALEGILEDMYGSAGFKVIYSKDEDVLQNYYKLFAVLGWQNDLVNISTSYFRWMSYSVTDELLNTKDIDINQPGIEVTVYAGEMISFSGEYSLMTGDSSYMAHEITGEIVIDLENIDISAYSSYKNTEYKYSGTINNSDVTAGGEISFDITDNLSWDIGYQYENTEYKTFGYTYTKNSGRIGIVAFPLKNIFFLTGITGGIDSGDVISADFDAGFTIKLYEHCRISVSYMLTGEFSSTSSSGERGRSSTSAKTEVSHTGNISTSFYF